MTKLGLETTFSSYLHLCEQISSEKFLSQIKSPTYFVIWGDSDYLGLQALSLLKNQLRLQNIEVLEIEDNQTQLINLQRLLFEPNLFGFASSYIFRSVQKIKEFDKIQKLLLQQKSSSFHSLVFFLNESSIKSTLLKTLESLNTFYIPCFAPKSFRDISTYIQKKASLLSLNLDRDCYLIFEKFFGVNIQKIDNALVQLSQTHKNQKTISPNDLLVDLQFQREDHLYKIDQLLLERQYSKAFILMTDLQQRGESPLVILSFLNRHCRNILLTLDFLRKKPSGGHELASLLKLPPFVAKNYQSLASKVAPQPFSLALNLCSEADRHLKSSRISANFIFSQILAALEKTER